MLEALKSVENPKSLSDNQEEEEEEERSFDVTLKREGKALRKMQQSSLQ
jgi:hypothetical protein